jgi:hypothetical protein
MAPISRARNVAPASKLKDGQFAALDRGPLRLRTGATGSQCLEKPAFRKKACEYGPE